MRKSTLEGCRVAVDNLWALWYIFEFRNDGSKGCDDLFDHRSGIRGKIKYYFNERSIKNIFMFIWNMFER